MSQQNPEDKIRKALKLLKYDSGRKQVRAAGVTDIFAASYSTVDERHLAKATEANISLSIDLMLTDCPNATLYYGNCSHPYPGASRDEGKLKSRMLGVNGISRCVDIGSITSSIDEALKLKARFDELEYVPKALLIATCELHSGAVRKLYRMVFPKSEILVACNPYSLEVQPDHPTPDQRSLDTWVDCSYRRYDAYTVVSLCPRFMQLYLLGILNKFQHASDRK